MASPAHPPPVICFGQFELDAANRELRKAGVSLKMHPQPFQVLQLLAGRPKQIVTRDEIRRTLWGNNTFVDFERGINSCVNQIRATLGDDPEKPRYVETLPRRGYRFIASVSIELPKQLAIDVALPPGTTESDLGASGSSADSSGRSDVHAVRPLTSILAIAKWSKKRLAVVSIAIISGFIAIGFGIHKWVSLSKGPNLPEIQISKLTDSGTAADVAISPNGQYVVYVRQDGQQQSLWLRQVAMSSEVQILRPGINAFHGISFSSDGNYIYFVRSDPNDPFFKYLYSMPTLGGTPRKLIADVDSPVSFSPDGQEFAYEHCIPSLNALELIVVNGDERNMHSLATFQNASCYLFQPGLNWSPDGRTIAVPVFRLGNKQSWELEAVSTRDGSAQELYSSVENLGRPVWLTNGKALLVPHYDQSSHREQLWTISFPGGETRRLTNDLSDYGTNLDITRGGGTVAAIEKTTIANVWVAPVSDAQGGRQITPGGIPMISVTEASDGKILSASADGKMWSMNPDGSGRTLFSDAHEAGWLTTCGRFVVFASYEAGTVVLIRVNADGSSPTKLVSGNLARLLKNSFTSRAPACSPDGKFVFYVTMDSPQKICRIPTEGGYPEEVGANPGDLISSRLSISPDGTLLAYAYDQYNATTTPGWKLAVIPVNLGQNVKVFDVPGGIEAPRWSPDGKSLQYLLADNGATNIWEQPLAGGKPQQLTMFTSGRIFDFDWSPDGKRLLLTRGESTSDVVLLTNIR